MRVPVYARRSRRAIQREQSTLNADGAELLLRGDEHTGRVSRVWWSNPHYLACVVGYTATETGSCAPCAANYFGVAQTTSEARKLLRRRAGPGTWAAQTGGDGCIPSGKCSRRGGQR